MVPSGTCSTGLRNNNRLAHRLGTCGMKLFEQQQHAQVQLQVVSALRSPEHENLGAGTRGFSSHPLDLKLSLDLALRSMANANPTAVGVMGSYSSCLQQQQQS